jgi:Tol biopolymer transport system component
VLLIAAAGVGAIVLGLALLCGGGATAGGTDVWDVAPAPDGKTVYFMMGSRTQFSLRALDLISGRATTVHEFEVYAGNLVCHPGGNWLLLMEQAARSRGQIWRLERATRQLTPFVVSSMSDSSPSISPDGKTVTFARAVRQYGRGFGGVGWADADVWAGACKLAASHRQLTHLKAKWVGAAAFLPDGHRAVVTIDTMSSMDLYLLNLGDGAMQRITHGGSHNRDPCVDRDGSTVVFVAASTRTYQSELFRMRPDGTGVRQLTRMHSQCTTPRFLPNSQSVVFVLGGREIWRVDSDGTNLRKLLPSEATASGSH